MKKKWYIKTNECQKRYYYAAFGSGRVTFKNDTGINNETFLH